MTRRSAVVFSYVALSVRRDRDKRNTAAPSWQDKLRGGAARRLSVKNTPQARTPCTAGATRRAVPENVISGPSDFEVAVRSQSRDGYHPGNFSMFISGWFNKTVLTICLHCEAVEGIVHRLRRCVFSTSGYAKKKSRKLQILRVWSYLRQ